MKYITTYYSLLSTVSNYAAPVNETNDETSTVIEERGDNTNNNSNGNSNNTPDTDDDGSVQNKPTAKNRKKTKAQQYSEELSERILNLAEKDDDPVDLELASLGSKIKRRLHDIEERDELLDELNEVARNFFLRKRTKRATASADVSVPTRPPPPLQMQPPQVPLAEDGMLLEVSELPPLRPYNAAVEYVQDPISKATYMKM